MISHRTKSEALNIRKIVLISESKYFSTLLKYAQTFYLTFLSFKLNYERLGVGLFPRKKRVLNYESTKLYLRPSDD